MSMLDNLKKGMEVLVTFVGLFVTIYATLFIGLLVIGVIANVAQSGDVNVSSQTETTIGNVETDVTNQVDTLTNPITVLVSLIVVGVLTAFINFGGSKGSSGSNKGGVF